MKLLAASFVAGASGYVNNYPTKNNAFDIALPSSDVRSRSFAFMLGDYGLQGPVFEGSCQKAVADMMRAKRKQLEEQGKSLIFVTALGDNFYGAGLKDARSDRGHGLGSDLDSDLGWDGSDQWGWWDTAYENLTDVKWLGVLGNHDLGWCDGHATCPDKAPRATINGQPYASNQLDVDKGGHRMSANAHNFHIPDFNYQYMINELNLEIYALDQNHRDEAGVWRLLNKGPTGSYTCGKRKDEIEQRLEEVAAAGEQMLEHGAASGAHDPKTKRNIVIMQHYPNTCHDLVSKFSKAAPESAPMLDIHCVFGHLHSTRCESSSFTANESSANDDGSATDCKWAQMGGGGGCCANEAVEKGKAGFGVLYFLPDGSMRIEQVTSGQTCSVMKNHPSPRPSPFPSPPTPPTPAQDTLRAGDTLRSGQSLVSASSNARLDLQSSDGNLVLRAGGDALWASNTVGHPNSHLAFQTSDGNLVLHASNGKPTWSSGNHEGATTVKLQDDCDLVMTDSSGKSLWSLGTSCKKTFEIV